MRYTPPPGHHVLHAVDLGKRKVGVASALVSPDGEGQVFSAGTVAFPHREDWAPDAMARRVDAWMGHPQLPEVMVCEWPQKYDVKTLYHEDLDSLYAVGHRIARLRGRWAKKWRPAQWKGNVPKAAHHERLRRVITPEEDRALRAALVSQGRSPHWFDSEDAHDMWDALGILLYALGRTRRGGRLP